MNTKNSAFGQQFDTVGNDAFFYIPHTLCFVWQNFIYLNRAPQQHVNRAQHVQFSHTRCSVMSLVLQQRTVLSLGEIY